MVHANRACLTIPNHPKTEIEDTHFRMAAAAAGFGQSYSWFHEAGWLEYENTAL
jgi:hypothetical protein